MPVDKAEDKKLIKSEDKAYESEGKAVSIDELIDKKIDKVISKNPAPIYIEEMTGIFQRYKNDK